MLIQVLHRSLRQLIKKLKVSIFWQMKQKCENLSLKVFMIKSVCVIFFSSPFISTTHLCQHIGPMHLTTGNLHYTRMHHFLVDNQNRYQLYDPRRQLQQLNLKIIHQNYSSVPNKSIATAIYFSIFFGQVCSYYGKYGN